MGIFDRYLARQVLVSTLLAVTVLSVVMVLGNVFKRLLALPPQMLHDLPWSYIGRFIGFVLLSSLSFTVPWSLLTAILLVFGRMSADNELLAMRMSGRSLVRICAPIFAIAAAVTLFCFWINLMISPLATREMKRLLSNVARDNPILLFTPDQVIDNIDGMAIYLGGREGHTLKNFQAIQFDERNFPISYLSAREVDAQNAPDIRGLRLVMKDGTMLQRDQGTGIDALGRPRGPGNLGGLQPPTEFGEHEVDLPLEKIYEKAERLSPGMMDDGQLRAALTEQNHLADQPPPPPPPGGKKRHKGPVETTPEQKASELRTELNRRYSISLAGIVFALAGIPLGVTAQRRETATGFALSLIIGVVYLSFIILCDSVLKSNPSAQPHLLVWLPNLLFLSLGGWLFWRLQRR